MDDLLRILEFILYTPFEKNIIFFSIIFSSFIVSFIMSWNNNRKRLSFYKKNIDTLLFDDYENGVASQSVAGILMSIGIIGTFFLIYDSLSHLDVSSSDKMIQVISQDIAPAFSISALGIFASIVYIILEKVLILGIYYKSRIVLLKWNKKYKINTYSNIIEEEKRIAIEMLEATKQQAKTFESLGTFSDGLADMSENMKKFGNIAETLEETLNPKVLGEVISSALLKDLNPVLKDIQSITSNVDKNSQKITRFLEEDLKNEIMIPLKKSVDNTSDSMKEMREVLKDTSSVMNKTSEGIEKISDNLIKLEESQTKFVKNLDTVLDKQKIEFEETTNTITGTYKKLTDDILQQTEGFEQNSKDITDSFKGLSSEMQEFLIGYKDDYKAMLEKQEKAIEETSSKAIEVLNSSKNTIENAGQEASNVIDMASGKLANTLDGVDNALVKTSDTIVEKLTEFKDAYTDTLKLFLDSQADELNKVFGEHTEKLKLVVVGFKDTLGEDVNNRKLLNEDLEKLVKTTNGFVSSTQAMITTAFDKQQSQLVEFMKNNKSMEHNLNNLINNATDISDNGNKLTKELIDTTANLSKQFNNNQTEILKKYQVEVDEHLKEILGYMATIIEASHIDNDE